MPQYGPVAHPRPDTPPGMTTRPFGMRCRPILNSNRCWSGRARIMRLGTGSPRMLRCAAQRRGFVAIMHFSTRSLAILRRTGRRPGRTTITRVRRGRRPIKQGGIPGEPAKPGIAAGIWTPSCGPGPATCMPPRLIITRRQRVLNRPELGRVGQVLGRTRTGHDAQQGKHGQERDGVSLYGSLISGASAHVVILYSPASIVRA